MTQESHPGAVEQAVTLSNAVLSVEPYKAVELDISTSPITKGDLLMLLNLPAEVSLHEADGKIIYTRGEEHNVKSAVEKSSRFSLHTHPLAGPNTTVDNTFLSLTDVLQTWQLDHDNTLLMLVTSNGILTYRAPQVDPTAEGSPRIDQTTTDPLRMLARWSQQQGINLLGGASDSIPPERFMAEMRKFCTTSGMIVDETNWDDTEGVGRALQRINTAGNRELADETLAVQAARRVLKN